MLGIRAGLKPRATNAKSTEGTEYCSVSKSGTSVCPTLVDTEEIQSLQWTSFRVALDL